MPPMLSVPRRTSSSCPPRPRRPHTRPCPRWPSHGERPAPVPATAEHRRSLPRRPLSLRCLGCCLDHRTRRRGPAPPPAACPGCCSGAPPWRSIVGRPSRRANVAGTCADGGTARRTTSAWAMTASTTESIWATTSEATPVAGPRRRATAWVACARDQAERPAASSATTSSAIRTVSSRSRDSQYPARSTTSPSQRSEPSPGASASASQRPTSVSSVSPSCDFGGRVMYVALWYSTARSPAVSLRPSSTSRSATSQAASSSTWRRRVEKRSHNASGTPSTSAWPLTSTSAQATPSRRVSTDRSVAW